MEKAGIVRRSNSPWASALHMVLNIRDFTNNMAGSHMFSTLDLMKGFYQVEMFPDDIPNLNSFRCLLACGMRGQLSSV